MKRRFLYIIMALTAALTVAAQKPHSYYCDFEDEEENALWTLNKPKNESYTWVNKWIIGSEVYSLGQKSMYISSDGTNAKYAKTQSRIMIAWRELEMEAGRYDVAFDWMCGGDSARACLLAAWVPETQFGEMSCKLNDDYKAAKWIKDNMMKFNGSELLTGGSVWTHAVDTLVSDGTPHRLVFLFIYSGAAQIAPPGPCVDNIQLSRNNCGAPTNMSVKTLSQAASLSWSSPAEAFNFRLHRMGDNFATLIKGVKQNPLQVSLKDGVYDIQIQTICEGDTSVWYNFPTAFIYETKCFDYLDLTDDRCYYSEETASDYHDNDTLLKPGRIDKGFTSMESRHTIHYNPDEYDARTFNSVDSKGNPVPPLKTVPEGALASVRVGSWEKWARVARVEYDFVVDAEEAAVLMLQYAMVLESSGHGDADRPRLTIDIVDAKTGVALSKCTTVDLASKTSGDGWFRVPDGSDGSRDVCWRDWTTLGLNLAEYDGMHVKVKVTAIGCTASIHYGYAYFTLTCTSGKLKGIQCGWTPTNEFIAPEGFNYRWYKVTMPSETLGREATMHVNYTDTNTYAVDLTYKSNAKCGFTLYANATPRFPVPRATYKLEQRNCGNYITFNNTSYIRTADWKTREEKETKVRPEYILWDFGDIIPEGLDTPEKRWSPSFRLPDEEANYHFVLYAGVGLCDSAQHFYIHVPKVGKDSIVVDEQRCEGDLFNWKGKYYHKDTTIIDHDYNMAGCDSTHVINLRFVDAIHDTLDIKIPEGSSYPFGDEELTKSGVYKKTFTSAAGCDSIVLLTLTVVEPLVVEIVSVESPCPGDVSFLIETHARKGIPDTYKLSFSEEAGEQGFLPQSGPLNGGADNTITVPMPIGALPGYYPFAIHFDSNNNGPYDVDGEVAVRYPATLIQQRWDDVLGILNADYNGGYDFMTFQWYLNGTAIDGATEPYLYVEGKLKPGDEYSVELMEEGDERSLRTCAYVVPASSAAAPAPAAQRIMQNGNIYILYNGRIYNAQGVLVNFIY